MSDANKPVRLAGTMLGRSRHVCAFFHSKDEEYRVLLPFIKEGFEQGDKAFHHQGGLHSGASAAAAAGGHPRGRGRAQQAAWTSAAT